MCISFSFFFFFILLPQIPLAVVICRHKADPSINASGLNNINYNEVITEKRLVMAELELQ